MEPEVRQPRRPPGASRGRLKRRFLAPVAVALAAGLLLTANDGGATPPTATYAVSADARLCPSPMCGGWFLKRVNQPRTRCLDGVLRTRCYVASIRGTARTPTGGVFLARGRITAAKLSGFPGYAMLELDQVWSPGSGTAIEPEVVYRARDNGVRCITAPCFSFDAQLVERARMTRLSDVDLSSARLTPKQRRRATNSLTTVGLLVSGRIVAVPEAGPAGTGRVLVASEVWLEVP
jgi:hypothetical protein